MAIIASDGIEKFLELFASSHVTTISHQGAMVKYRMMSKEWIVAIADGGNPDGLMALGDFLGYGSIANSEIEMFSFPAGSATFIVATLRGDSFDPVRVADFFPKHPEVHGHGWEEQKPALIIADYAEAPVLFDTFMSWLDGCGKEMN